MEQKENKYWRSLGQLKNSPEYRRQLLEEYQTEHADDLNQFSRRRFLSIMGASIALAGLAGCRRPVEKIVPYVKQPEEIIPGVPEYYATTMPLGNSAYGVVVESHEGRPTKIEGNPKHPSSMGATNLFMQASILNLYDPDRSNSVRNNGAKKKIDDFKKFWKEQLEKYTKNKGEGLAVISEAFSSPTLERLKAEFHKYFPEANWIVYEPINNINSLTAIKNLTGKWLRPLYHYDKADVILSLDADFLQSESESLSAAQGFASKRKITSPEDKMNRLYVVESGYSITGAAADHRMKLKSGDIGKFLLALIGQLKARGTNINVATPRKETAFDLNWLLALADDLINARGKSLIVVGSNQPTIVHELALAVNDALGNLNQTIGFVEDNESVYPENLATSGLPKSETLIIFGGNPVYNAPVDTDFANKLSAIKNKIHLSEYYDETSQVCDWHIPRAHYLESWGDARAVDGTLSIIQPLIAPLFGSIGDIEFLSMINSGESKSGYDTVRESWKKYIHGDFEKGWRIALHDGVLANSASRSTKASLNSNNISVFPDTFYNEDAAGKFEIVLQPSLLYDGRYANNGWLQELPNPITKLVWDNAALISVTTAEKYNLENSDIVKLATIENDLEIPVWIVPGIADDSIQLSLGYGRTKLGRIANNVGANVYRLLENSGKHILSGETLTKIGRKYKMSNTQDHSRMEGRAIFREADFEEYKRNPEFAREMVEHPPLKSIYPDWDYSKGYQWGMVIDLNACIGCGVCTIACQSENNVPIVGKKQVGKGREMHWMRNDRYYRGDENDPELVIMPVPCQQCENAPCEEVCPVAATSHDREGLNVMTYNRCVGTRYCSNNCPYKVRRFNFFNYTYQYPEIIKMVQNPEVTVRSRGVMEKCSFCLQRIVRAKRTAKHEGRTVHDGEFKTACQQACPTGAIAFGNIIEKDSAVAAQKKIDRNYALLAELNVRPRNSYLARIRNRNEKIKS